MIDDWQVLHVIDGEKLTTEDFKCNYANEINEMLLRILRLIASIKGFEMKVEN